VAKTKAEEEARINRQRAFDEEKHQLSLTVTKYETLVNEYKEQIGKTHTDLTSESVRYLSKVLSKYGLEGLFGRSRRM
jgi:hypothetical protein